MPQVPQVPDGSQVDVSREEIVEGIPARSQEIAFLSLVSQGVLSIF